ncbi:vacuole membrane protein 1 isoform X1 [Tribolium castaneum]|uniref:Vacuole membrane protein 1-like Protein n=2 Tax=Tribolium castaneum TaxID=7070 RepID=D2A456_TRICA|nr:PREDICTED: vacuole membrane protein 1 isoform X1 [Tribolium castaneum]EFA04843.1 Vacuole membrane protein 1-like Protein [Tribolium castaneum]|eukprot:XP_969557.1 PREDICTED: vacuole membrane protein 1 isoform X1 [Tribolium castaneum]
MAGKKIRSRTSQNSISVSSLSNRTLNVATSSNPVRGKPADELLAMTKEQLKNECRKKGQKTTGNKIELLQRLGYKMTKRRENSTNGAAVTPDETPTGGGDLTERTRKEKERKERESLVLWKRPLTTLEYSTKEVIVLLTTYGRKILEHKKIVLFVTLTLLSSYLLVKTAGPHQSYIQIVYKQLLWCSYWIGLGILSSVGLGTGLHTFLLYLGPHIAAVTLAAYECESLNFPEPPYPDEIICPDERNPLAVSILSIMSKVRLEAMCWGAGTALGELPPYFMARAARLSGIDPDDEDDDLKEFEELKRKQNNKTELTLIEKGKLFVEELVQRVGFLGILACASIPNPLFDLAGITCGHFLVPFWTFFGATLIGKAIIKMHIQKLFVIIAFNETLIVTALQWLKYIPVVGEKLQVPFKAFLDGQKSKLHQSGGGAKVESGNVLSSIFEKFVVAMILYFIVSIVNSFAQSYYKRIHKKKTTKVAKD